MNYMLDQFFSSSKNALVGTLISAAAFDCLLPTDDRECHTEQTPPPCARYVLDGVLAVNNTTSTSMTRIDWQSAKATRF
jgi:hypothetical protein